MPEAVSEHTRARAPRLTLNSDGRRHPVLNVVAFFTLIAGVVAFATGLIVRDHLFATVVGIVAFGTGLVAQMMSATREQRIIIVGGLVAAFVGMGLAIAHGGFG
jgi:hypothetical protein